MSSHSIAITNDELVTVREAMRGLNKMVDALERGEQEKFVLTKHGKMRAVLVPVGAASVNAVREAFLDGFFNSSEGYNGEYPFDEDRSDPRLQEMADRYLERMSQ